MTITLTEDIAKAVKEAAQKYNIGTDEFVNGVVYNQIDNTLATLVMSRIEKLISDSIMPALLNTQMNTFALRHQVTNLHSDILDTPERAALIAKEANEISYDLIFGEEDEQN